jgi:hypothetical protein
VFEFHIVAWFCVCVSSLARLAQTAQLEEVIAGQSSTGPDPKPIVLSLAMTYTIGAIPLNLTKDLALTGGAFESRARLECEGTCFHLFNGTSISMSGLDIVFGTNATGLSSALVEVPTPQTQGFAGAANVTIVNCKIQSHKFATSNTSLSQAFPLVLHESGATMRLIALQTSTINVDTLTAMQFAAGHVGMGASLLFTLYAFEMRFSSLFCGDLDLDCISFEKHRGMYSISLLDSNLAYSSSTMASISNTALLRFESTPETALRPSVEIQSLIVPSGQQLLFRFADNIYLENVTFNANAALVVASVDLFRARNVTQLASSFRLEPMTFDDVRNITMENITIVGFAAVSRQCALLPIISVGVSTYRTVPNSASITALKATGTFCNSSAFDEFAAGIVSVKDIDHVQLVDSVFDDVRTQRALMVRNASIVSVLSSRFLNARAGSPGLVRIFGADKLRTKLRVENTTFDNIVTQTDSALIASNVVATLRAVNFTSCAEVELQSANTCAALTLDDANWAFNSEVLLEDVLFSENTGNGIARINMASHGTARPLLFRRVRFNANQALTSVCKLSGASDYTLDNVDMFSNTAQSALSFPDNTPITGKANGVCLCGNSVGTDSNCAVMSLLNVSSTSCVCWK